MDVISYIKAKEVEEQIVAHKTDKNNPHNVTKSDVDLSNVANDKQEILQIVDEQDKRISELENKLSGVNSFER